ncbi:MAG: hypothetical protein ACRDN0_25005, partial [Trebonia sp.]
TKASVFMLDDDYLSTAPPSRELARFTDVGLTSNSGHSAGLESWWTPQPVEGIANGSASGAPEVEPRMIAGGHAFEVLASPDA